MDTRISAINILHNKISEWWRKLPEWLHLTPSGIVNFASDTLPKVLLIHSVYHQSLVALHASIVPVFSWSPGDETWLAARQTSAQLAFDHACAVSDLLESLLLDFSMFSAIPSFVAYAAYCSCAIQIPFMWSSDTKTRDMVHKNVRTNVKLINAVAQYWKFTSLFVSIIK
jgi:hypothetical protein